MERRIEYRQLVHILALFLIVQLGGILLTIYFLVPSGEVVTLGPAQASSPSTILFYALIIIVIGPIITIALLKSKRTDLFFVFLEAYAIIVGAAAMFWIIFTYYFPANLTYTAIAAIAVAVLLVVVKNLHQSLRNTMAILSSIGVGVILGVLFGFWGAFLLMAIVAVYDYVAVFITKHMVTMGQAMASRNMAFLVGTQDVEVMPKGYFTKKEQAAIKKSVPPVKKIKSSYIREHYKRGELPVVSQMMLGTGDLVFALMVTIGAFSSLDYFLGTMLLIGGIIGLFATMYILRRYQAALPAIPPLFAFMSMMVGIVFFVRGNLLFGAFFELLFLSVFMIMILTVRKLMRDRERY